MPDYVRQIMDLIETRPLETVACAIVALLYVNLMSGPRVR